MLSYSRDFHSTNGVDGDLVTGSIRGSAISQPEKSVGDQGRPRHEERLYRRSVFCEYRSPVRDTSGQLAPGYSLGL